MSSRTVSVVLTAQVQNYLTNMRAAQAETLRLEATTKTITQQFAAHNEALTRVGVGLAAVGATAAAGIVLAVKASTEFGAKMAQLQSLSHANAATMRQLSDAAMTVGTAYGFSASQVADAQIELVKAGVTVQQQLGGALKGALSLAAAGQLDVAQATEITTVAMTQFALSAKDVPHLADLLAAGADKALGSVADLGEGLKNGGLQAHNMGLSIEDTVGLLSAFANAGILGAEAGTQMRSMFLRLQNPTTAAKETLDKYGIAINDASGKFVGITKFASELHDGLDGLSQAQRNQALATVFGSHAIVGATVLYQDAGKEAEKAGNSIGDWIDKVNESGFASAQAAGKLNSLQGDVQKLAAAFQTDLIKAGSSADGALRPAVQTITALLNVVGDVPQPVAAAGGVVVALTAGVGLLGGAALVAVPKIAAMKLALQELNVSGKTAAVTFAKGAGLSVGLTLLTAGLAGAGQQGLATAEQINQTGLSAKKSFADLDKLFNDGTLGQGKASLKEALRIEGVESAGDKIAALGGLLPGLSAGVLKNEGAFDALGQQLSGLAQRSLPAAQSSFAGIAKQYHLTAGEQTKLLDLMPAYRDELVKQATAAHISVTDQNLLSIAQGKGSASVRALAAAQASSSAAATRQANTLAALAGQASAATTNIDDLQKTIEGFGSAQLDARSATRAMYQAIADATKAVHDNGAGLDVTTQKGRDNQAALDGIATAADQAASKILKQTGSTKDAARALQTGRDAYIKTAIAMHLSRDAAKKLADQLELIPGNVRTAVDVSGVTTAITNLQALRQEVKDTNGLRANVLVNVTAQGTDALNAQNYTRRAAGGAIDGTGPKGVDSVFAILAPGEHVLTASDVDRLGGQGGAYAFRSALQSGAIAGYAKGGAIDRGGVAVLRQSKTKKAAAPKPPSANQIVVQQEAAAAAKRQADAAQRSLATANRRLKTQQKAAAAAAKALSNAQDAAAKIHGKGSSDAKHAATLRVRALSKASKAAAARVKATQKTVDTGQQKIDDAKQRQQDALDAAQTLRNAREDFVSTQRRATAANPIDPLSYIDQLRSMSRDDTYSTAVRSKFDDAANGAEKAIVNLQTASTAAAQKLDDLRSSSDQMKQSVTQAIASGYTLAGAPLVGAKDATTRQTASGWITQNGVRVQSYSTQDVAAVAGRPTAASIAGYYRTGAASAGQFAAALKSLAGRGLNAALLAELAGMGTEAGLPIAQAILSGSSADLRTINSGYQAIQSVAAQAGGTVADANYAKQIAAADANAKQITAEIAVQGDKLRKVIATAFGLKGYATGTASATAGIRWVGEDGPELLGFGGGERVLSAPDSRRWVRGGVSSSGGPVQPVEVHVAPFPDVITVQDMNGFSAPMRVIAHQVVSARNDELAVRVMGGAA